MSEAKVNLFVYGSLRDSSIFESVCGLRFVRKASRVDNETLFAEPALLPHYRSVSPDNVYYYAIEAPSARIEGLVIRDVPIRAMVEIDRYEGKRYERETVRVNTAHGTVEAQAYLVSHDSMKKHFGDRFHVNLIHELWLRKRIEKFIKRHIRPGDRTADAESERRADRELLATTERDLVMSHYRTDAVSDYYLEHELDRPRPSIKHLYDDREAEPFIGNYLAMAVRQVLLNQLDEHVQSHYRFEIERLRTSERFFNRSVSVLVALRMINRSRESVDLIVNKCLQAMPSRKSDLIDYVKYAVRAAKSMFDPRVAESNLNHVRSNLQTGLVPLGFEMELSNLGAAAVKPQNGPRKVCEAVYDGFKYFYDFHLDILCWKLGGYVDDHTGATDLGRRSGFLELAPGRLSIAGELSRPATPDPWLLNQLVHEIADFYDVRPHSLHLSLQLRRRQLDKQKILPLGFVKCLLALGGGPERKDTGRLWVSRMGKDEIKQFQLGEELVFARTSKRRWYLGGDDIANKPPAQSTTHVQQYKFIRLDKRVNYEPLVLCLKGLQLAYNPSDYLTVEQLRKDPWLREQYEELKKWSLEPTEISRQTIDRFVAMVQTGLMNEGHRQPVHKLHYIDWALSAIDSQLRTFNKQLRQSPPA